jgi:hypothetical protein
VASQCVELTMPKVPFSSGRVVKLKTVERSFYPAGRAKGTPASGNGELKAR